MSQESNPLPPSWTYMQIEEADEPSASARSRCGQVAAVWLSALKGRLRQWRRRFSGGKEQRNV